MASNDKTYRSALSQDLLSHTVLNGKSVLTLNLPKAFLCFAVLMSIFVYGNLALACSTQFHCGKFLPTPGYLGCFRGHDRIFILACTYYGLLLPLTFLGLQSKVGNVSNRNEQSVLLFLSCAIPVLLPVLALTDEVTSTHFLPFEQIYVAAGYLFSVCSGTWLLLVYRCLAKDKPVFNRQERFWLNVLLGFVVLTLGFGVVMCIEWVRSGSQRLVSEQVESVCEWVLTLVGIFAPAVVSQMLRGLHLSFATQAVRGSEHSTELSSLGN